MVAFADPACRPRLETLRDRVLRARRRCCPVDLSSPAAERVVYRGRAQPDRFDPWVRVDLHHYAESARPSSCAAC
jgi:hypothetical protein